MDTTDLQAFARIADLGSITAAARALAVPKSSVSRGLARLESMLGTVLVERSTRQLRLTEAGHLFREHAGRALAELEDGRNAVATLQDRITGEFRIDAPYAFTQYAIAPMLPAFIRSHPGIGIRLSVTNERIDPIAQGVDAVIRIGATRSTGLIARKLLSFVDWLCASPEYLERRGIPRTIEDVAGHDLVGTTASIRWLPEVMQTGVSRRPLVVPEPAAIRSLLLAGGGIGSLPSFLASRAVRDNKLVRLLSTHEFGRHDIFLVSPSRPRLNRLRPFIETLVASLKQIED